MANANAAAPAAPADKPAEGPKPGSKKKLIIIAAAVVAVAGGAAAFFLRGGEAPAEGAENKAAAEKNPVYASPCGTAGSPVIVDGTKR